MIHDAYCQAEHVHPSGATYWCELRSPHGLRHWSGTFSWTTTPTPHREAHAMTEADGGDADE